MRVAGDAGGLVPVMAGSPVPVAGPCSPAVSRSAAQALLLGPGCRCQEL